MKGWVGWAFTTALGLVTLQALATREAPGRIGDLLTDANKIVQRVLDPDVAAIPDLSAGRAGSIAGGVAGGRRTTTGPGKTLGTATKTTTPRLPVPGQQHAV